MRYRAFISYSHADAATAAWLHRKLEGWRVPRRMRVENPALPDKLAPVFRDREELGSAGELGPQIQAALSQSEALIVLCSPEAARSSWVDSEVRAFRASGRGDRVFALIVSGEPHSAGERECFPPALRESEPLAADLRPGKDGKDLALLKLIAGLLDVPLDTLRQREARRRHQRQLAITSLALVVMVITSVLAIQAHIARQAAERRQKQAENLVNFMLGDLNDKLAQVARLDILEGVHDHAMEYFQSLPEADVTDEALAQRAKALVRIGSVRLEQGHLEKARDSYVAAERLTSRLAQAAPRDLSRQFGHTDVLAYLGMVAWYQGRLDEAKSRFDAARGLLLRAQAFAPDDTTLLYQLSTIDNNAGHVLEGRGDIARATLYYRSMLATCRKLAALQPDNKDWQTQLGFANNNLAKMALLSGDLAGAIAGYRADVAVQERLAKRDARDHQQAELLLISRAALGRTLALAGALEEGARTLQQSADEARKLHDLEPASVLFAEDVALYSTQLARLRRLQGDAGAAAELLADALAATDALLAKDKANASWQRERAEIRFEQAQHHLASGDVDAGRTAVAESLSALEPLFAQMPQDRSLLLATLSARLLKAQAAGPEASQALLRQSLADAAAQTYGARDPRLRALQAESLLRLHERERGEALAHELWQEGYRDPAFAALLRDQAVVVPAAPTPALAAGDRSRP